MAGAESAAGIKTLGPGTASKDHDATSKTLTSIALPDLVISDIGNIVGDVYILDFTIENIGTAPADLNGPDDEDLFDNVGFQALFSEDDIYGNGNEAPAGGAFLNDPLPELAPGETYTKSWSAGTANRDGRAYIGIKIDNQDVMNEENECNNTAMALLVPPTELWILR
jgi:hypothetical protein